MRKAILAVFLLLLGSMVLGATALREPLANAASPFTSVIIGNDATNPVPVKEQSTDGSGNIKVHEQGTANVHVTNASLAVEPTGTPLTVDLDTVVSTVTTNSYRVPAGKRFHIVYVNGEQIEVPPGVSPRLELLDAYSGGNHRYPFYGAERATLTGNSVVYYSGTVLIDAEPGDLLIINAGPSSFVHLTLDGYLVDAS